MAIDAGADRPGELGRTGDERGRRPQQPENQPQQQEQGKSARAATFQLFLRFGRACSSPAQLGQRGLLPGRRTNKQIAVRIGADDRGGRFVVQPLVAPAPDQPPVAQHVAIAEEVAVQVVAGWIVDQFREGPQEDFSQRAFGGRFAPRLVEPLAELGQVVAQQTLEVLGGGRLADHVFQPPTLVVADVKADGIVLLPRGFGNHAPQPAEEDAVIRPRAVEHGHTRFDGDRPIIASTFRQINTHESSSHSRISTETKVLAQTWNEVRTPRPHDKDYRAGREWDTSRCARNHGRKPLH